MSIKKSQAILKYFIDLKNSVCSRWAQKTKPWFVTLNFFQFDCFKTLNDRQSYVLRKFHKIEKSQLMSSMVITKKSRPNLFSNTS